MKNSCIWGGSVKIDTVSYIRKNRNPGWDKPCVCWGKLQYYQSQSQRSPFLLGKAWNIRCYAVPLAHNLSVLTTTMLRTNWEISQKTIILSSLIMYHIPIIWPFIECFTDGITVYCPLRSMWIPSTIPEYKFNT
jgi:hypothetical protein